MDFDRSCQHGAFIIWNTPNANWIQNSVNVEYCRDGRGWHIFHNLILRCKNSIMQIPTVNHRRKVKFTSLLSLVLCPDTWNGVPSTSPPFRDRIRWICPTILNAVDLGSFWAVKSENHLIKILYKGNKFSWICPTSETLWTSIIVWGYGLVLNWMV